EERLDRVGGGRRDDGGGKECKKHAEDEPPSRRIAEHAGSNSPDAEEIDRQQRKDCAELDEDCEGLAEIRVVETEKALDQEQVSGRGHRQELGQSLDDAQYERFE